MKIYHAVLGRANILFFITQYNANILEDWLVNSEIDEVITDVSLSTGTPFTTESTTPLIFEIFAPTGRVELRT